MSNDKPFVWTDELVLEYGRICYVNNDESKNTTQKLLEFKERKSNQPPIKEERIEVYHVKRIGDSFISQGFKKEPYQVYEMLVTKTITEDKFPLIKQAIEQALNNDTVVGVWREIGMDYYTQDGKKLCEWVAYERLFEQHQDTLNEMSKMYTQSEVDTIRKEAFMAGREVKPDLENFSLNQTIFVYNTYSRYLNSLPKEQSDKTIAQQMEAWKGDVVSDNSTGKGEWLTNFEKEFEERWNKRQEDYFNYFQSLAPTPSNDIPNERRSYDRRPTPTKEDTKVLFTTSDGIEIKEFDDCWVVKKDSQVPIKWTRVVKKGMMDGEVYFSTKEAAKQYCLLHKPCLSLSEIKEYVGVYSSDYALENLKVKAKQKLNL